MQRNEEIKVQSENRGNYEEGNEATENYYKQTKIL